MQSNDQTKPVIINNCKILFNINEKKGSYIICHRIIGTQKNVFKALKYLCKEGFFKPQEMIDLAMTECE